MLIPKQTFSRIDESVPAEYAPKSGALCQPFNPISGQADSRVIRAQITAFFFFYILFHQKKQKKKQQKKKIYNVQLSRRGENPPRGLHQCCLVLLRLRDLTKI
jgi:hypothetical protein